MLELLGVTEPSLSSALLLGEDPQSACSTEYDHTGALLELSSPTLAALATPALHRD